MAKKRRSVTIERDDEPTFELDLAPMLALMVTLIPIMLLSTVFVKVMIIESPLPQVVEKAIEEDRNNKNTVSLALQMNANANFEIQVSRGGKTIERIQIPNKGGNWNLEGLHSQAVIVKQKYPKKFRMDLIPSEKVKYDDIVKAMDALRQTRAGDPKFFILDEETKTRVETDALFPDVVFSNVLEG